MPPTQPLPRALTIAGSDSGGGAGIQADLKTFQELDTFGMSVLTALTAQNTLGVHGVHVVPPDFVQAQIDAVVGDIGVDAAKTGMLADAGVIKAVAGGVRAHGIARLVVDPVCASKHGDPLLAPDAVDALRSEIVPLAEVVTPNLGEVEVLTGVEVTGVEDLRPAAEAVKALGPRWVLVKGGHLEGNDEAVDLLFDGETEHRIAGQRLQASDTHGTGCTLAAAIAAYRARGLGVVEAVTEAKAYVTGAIAHGLRLGAGIGPVDHGWRRRGAQPLPRWSGVRRVGAIVLVSERADRLVAFYRAVGLPLSEERHGEGPLHWAHDLDGVHVAVFPGERGTAPARERGGATMLGLDVADLDGALAAARAAGATVLRPPEDAPWGRRAVVADPDGRPVELNQPHT